MSSAEKSFENRSYCSNNLYMNMGVNEAKAPLTPMLNDVISLQFRHI